MPPRHSKRLNGPGLDDEEYNILLQNHRNFCDKRFAEIIDKYSQADVDKGVFDLVTERFVSSDEEELPQEPVQRSPVFHPTLQPADKPYDPLLLLASKPSPRPYSTSTRLRVLSFKGRHLRTLRACRLQRLVPLITRIGKRRSANAADCLSEAREGLFGWSMNVCDASREQLSSASVERATFTSPGIDRTPSSPHHCKTNGAARNFGTTRKAKTPRSTSSACHSTPGPCKRYKEDPLSNNDKSFRLIDGGRHISGISCGGQLTIEGEDPLYSKIFLGSGKKTLTAGVADKCNPSRVAKGSGQQDLGSDSKTMTNGVTKDCNTSGKDMTLCKTSANYHSTPQRLQRQKECSDDSSEEFALLSDFEDLSDAPDSPPGPTGSPNTSRSSFAAGNMTTNNKVTKNRNTPVKDITFCEGSDTYRSTPQLRQRQKEDLRSDTANMLLSPFGDGGRTGMPSSSKSSFDSQNLPGCKVPSYLSGMSARTVDQKSSDDSSEEFALLSDFEDLSDAPNSPPRPRTPPKPCRSFHSAAKRSLAASWDFRSCVPETELPDESFEVVIVDDPKLWNSRNHHQSPSKDARTPTASSVSVVTEDFTDLEIKSSNCNGTGSLGPQCTSPHSPASSTASDCCVLLHYDSRASERLAVVLESHPRIFS